MPATAAPPGAMKVAKGVSMPAVQDTHTSVDAAQGRASTVSLRELQPQIERRSRRAVTRPNCSHGPKESPGDLPRLALGPQALPIELRHRDNSVRRAPITDRPHQQLVRYRQTYTYSKSLICAQAISMSWRGGWACRCHGAQRVVGFDGYVYVSEIVPPSPFESAAERWVLRVR